MPECFLCGMETDALYTCKRCGERFCEECGDVEEHLCLFCLDDEAVDDEYDDEEHDDEDETDPDWG